MLSSKTIITTLLCAAFLFLLSSCYKSTTTKKMLFGVTIEYASYRYPGYAKGSFNVEKSKKQIDLAKELGVNLVRFDIRNEALSYITELKKLDTIIRYARMMNLKILIGVYGMETWYNVDFLNYPYGGSGKASWKGFKSMYVKQVFLLANRYKPDYMIIVPECPFNIGNQINSVRSISEWVDFAKKLAKLVKFTSPKTRIIINEIPHVNPVLDSAEYKFTAAIMKDKNDFIDILGADSYNYDDLKADVNNLLFLKKKYNWHGELWITEANLVDNIELFNRPSTPEEDQKQKEFFVYAINLSHDNGFTGFCIFNFTDDANDGGCGWGITYKDFTPKPAFLAIKQLIAQINGN